MEKIVFSKFSNERDDRFCIRTDICKDERNRMFVRKSACAREGQAHIAAMEKWMHQLNEVYENTKITMNRCNMRDDAIEFEYLYGESLDTQFDRLLNCKRLDELEERILDFAKVLNKTADAHCFVNSEAFIQVFGETSLPADLRVQKVSNIDMVFSNIITAGGWQVIDYEWTFAFPIPVNFIIYRAMHYYVFSDVKRFVLKERNLFEKAGISRQELTEYEKMERHFQQYILGNHIPVRNMYQSISPGAVHPSLLLDETRKMRHKRMIQIYFDFGEGFGTKGSYNLQGNPDHTVDLELILPKEAKAVRIDPCMDRCEVQVLDTSGLDYETNGIMQGENWWIFDHEDPQIQILTEDFKEEILKVKLKYHTLSENMAEYLGNVSENMEDAAAKLREINNTKVWKTYRKYRNLVEKGNSEVENKEENQNNSSKAVLTQNKEDSLIYNIDNIQLVWDRLIIQGWMMNRDKTETILLRDGNNQEIDINVDRFPREDVNQIYGLDPMEKSGFHISFVRRDVKTGSVVLELANSLTKKASALNLFKYSVKAFLQRGKLKDMPMDYDTWIRRKSPKKAELNRQRKETFEYNPMFSVVIPLYNTPINYLEEIMESILNQTYSNVQLCLADGSTNDTVENYIKENYGSNSKVVYQRLSDNKGISQNTNEALKLAEGDFIMLSDHDDVVTLDALYEMVKAMNLDPDIDVLYTDEDKVDMDGKIYFDPHFKSDFNLDLLRSNNYICHIFVVKKSIVDEIGEFRSEYDGAQDYDFILRCCEKAKRVHHIPKILYHWRSHPNSTAGNPESKMYAYEAGRAAVAAHYERVGLKAEVTMTEYFGRYRTKFMVSGEPLISIIIPNKDHLDDLSRCIRSLYEKSTYQNFEVIIAENNSKEDKTFQYYETLEKDHANIRVVRYNHEFNYSAINNYAAGYAKGQYLLFLNNDTEVLTADWMEEMLGYCQRDDVGAVGAKLCYEDDTIQHAGIVLGLGGAAGHIFYRIDKNAFTYTGKTNSTQDISAVTAACMMTPKAVFESVEGFDEELKVAFNDVDYCLKVQQKGKLVVYQAYAEMYHYESKSRGSDKDAENKKRFQDETKRFMKKWESVFEKGDPYYNPNLTLNRPDCTLRM